MSSVVCACWFAAACGGAERTGPAEGADRLAADDLQALVTVSPDATGWSWTVDPQTRSRSPAPFDFDESEPSYDIQKAVAKAYEDAGLVKSATSDWWDNAGGKKASSFANLVATADDAKRALEADHEFARHWFPEFEHQEIRDIDAGGIGEESWAVQGGGAKGGFVEIGWTRGNATLAVYVNCYPCRSDLADAARRWAQTIDAAARATAD